jgi:ribonuclease E
VLIRKLKNNIRAQTLESTAPALIYEESDIVKRSLRDLFRNDVNEIIIEGDQAYNSTIQFMEVVAPNQKNIVKKHSGKQPIFEQHKIEDQLDELYEPTSKLESGGYVVITPTEALVSIDVNSGKATRERNVEDTAYRTNIEAAREIARQLRLRDLAGLVVIDFIDMRDVRNRKAVERELKEALKSDRAKIQVGRISPFGLLEMSRQRLRSSLVESSSVTCPMCKGLGVVRSNESVSLKIFRAIEAEASKNNTREIRVEASFDIAFSILNKKRDEIKALEQKEDVRIYINGSHEMLPNQFKIDSVRGRNKRDFNSDDHSHSHSDASERPERPERKERREDRRDDRREDRKPQNADANQQNFNQEIPEYILNEESQAVDYDQSFNSLDNNGRPSRNRRGGRGRNNRGERGERGPRNNQPRENNGNVDAGNELSQPVQREGGREGREAGRNRNRNRRRGGRNTGAEANGNREFNGNANGNYDSAPSFEPINDNGFHKSDSKQPSYAKYSENSDNFGGDEKSPTSKLKGLWKKITS